jgi:hypothetical protein
MEQKAARPNKQVSIKRNHENRVMAVFAHVQHALDTQREEQQIRQGIHNLGGVGRGIVILFPLALLHFLRLFFRKIYLFTPIQGRCHRAPVPSLGRRIGNKREMRPVFHREGRSVSDRTAIAGMQFKPGNGDNGVGDRTMRDVCSTHEFL